MALDSKHPRVHEQIVTLRNALNQTSDVPAKLLDLLNADFKAVEPSTDLKKYNDDFLAANKDSPRHVLSAIKIKKLLGQNQTKSEEEVLKLLEIPGIEFQDAIEALETLKRWKSSQVDEFKKAAQAKFPDVTRLA